MENEAPILAIENYNKKYDKTNPFDRYGTINEKTWTKKFELS